MSLLAVPRAGLIYADNATVYHVNPMTKFDKVEAGWLCSRRRRLHVLKYPASASYYDLV
jgi:hypothetical protein